ncbi:hypothetical protein RhiJN_11755 [Ceratobasidium sp. AG-Ba]|nr:hypothetical protein RhiJN_11755 [Ceratobasidium sp. AG-Ba]QRW12376.1 hypothetical protein RhiLY_11375 [Ceratobasidium sp. AG-Ba]
MRNHNVAGRERNLFLFCNICIFILGYSKTTALTGVERTNVHALPLDITFLLFVYNALVRPLAVQWLRDLYKPNTSEKSNNKIDELFKQADLAKTIDEDPEGSESEQDIADQEEDDNVYADLESDEECDKTIDDDKVETARDILTPWLDEQAPNDTIFNALNGHSGHVPSKNYALEDGDQNLSSSKSFKKYIEACQLMHDWLNGKELPVKPSYKEQIQQDIKRLNDRTERIEAELTHVKEEQRKIGQKMDLIIELLTSR